MLLVVSNVASQEVAARRVANLETLSAMASDRSKRPGNAQDNIAMTTRQTERRSSVRLLFTLSFAALVSAACEPEQNVPAGMAVQVDTVGRFERITYTGAAPRWEIEPVLSLGSVGALTGKPTPEEFGRVAGVVSDAEGRIFIADGIALEIRVFDSDGQFLRSLGRKGSGPGEVGGLQGIAWVSPDTLVAMDDGNARLLLLSAAGEHVGEWPWVRMRSSDRLLFNGGLREVYAHTFRTEPGRLNRAVWARYTPDGPVDSVSIPRPEPRPGSEVTCRGNGIGRFENPFGDQFLAVPAPDGRRVVAWASEYSLAWLDASDDTVRVMERDVPVRPVPDSAWARVAERFREFQGWWSGADCEGDIGRPEHIPTLRGIFFDHAGRMLVEYTTPEGRAFDIFDEQGLLQATIPSPADRDASVPPFVRDGVLYAVARDSLGTQQVRAFRIDQAEGER